MESINPLKTWTKKDKFSFLFWAVTSIFLALRQQSPHSQTIRALLLSLGLELHQLLPETPPCRQMRDLAHINLWSNPSSNTAYPIFISHCLSPEGQENVCQYLRDERKELWSSGCYYQLAKCSFITPESFHIAHERVRRERHGGWYQVVSKLAAAAGSKKHKPTTVIHHTGTRHTQISLHFREHQLTSSWVYVPKTKCDLKWGQYY